MAILLAHVKVEDYDRWRRVFEEAGETRKQHGCTGTHIFMNAHDRNEIIINFQWDSEENARGYLEADELRQALKEAGVLGPPQTWFLEDGGRTPS